MTGRRTEQATAWSAKDIAFRRAHADDARDLAELQDIANEGQLSRVTWANQGADWREIGTAAVLDVSSEMCWRNCVVAEHDGKAVGFLNSIRNDAVVDVRPAAEHDPVAHPFLTLRRALGRCLYLRAMAVKRSARGKGIASRLLNLAERAASLLGAKKLGVIVHEANRTLLASYGRRGYEVIASSPVRSHASYPVGTMLHALRATPQEMH